mgnify:CR=1 FL=1
MPRDSQLLAADEAVLLAALRNEPLGWARFDDHFSPLLYGIARRRAPELPDDLRDDIVQEMLLDIVQTTESAYRAAGKTAAGFIASFSSHAAQRVRAAYRQPGTTSRKRGGTRTPPQRISAAPESVPSHDEVCIASVEVALYMSIAASAVRAGMLVLLAGGSMDEASAAATLPRTSFTRALRALPARAA